jgi:hypothetical protein
MNWRRGRSELPSTLRRAGWHPTDDWTDRFPGTIDQGRQEASGDAGFPSATAAIRAKTTAKPPAASPNGKLMVRSRNTAAAVAAGAAPDEHERAAQEPSYVPRLPRIGTTLATCSNGTIREGAPAGSVLHENTPTERRVLAAFLYHAGLSYPKIKPFIRGDQAMVSPAETLLRVRLPGANEVVFDETKNRYRRSRNVTSGRRSTARPSKCWQWRSHRGGRTSTRCCFSRSPRTVPRSPAGAGRPRPVVRLAAGTTQLRVRA